MNKTYPKIVSLLGYKCDAWLIGGAVDEESPKDYDVFIPYEYWNDAMLLIPKHGCYINTYGGLKFAEETSIIDIFTGDMSKLLSSDNFNVAKHLNSGIIIRKENQ